VNESVLILIVEDNALIQDVVQDALTEGGYNVVLASGGDEAMAKLDEIGTYIRALVTDVDLPPGKLTGWDVARHAREITPELPIIYMTGASGGDWSSKGVPKSLLLAKPFAPAQIVSAVSQLLNASSLMSE
jgi:CheY-like chemotaxis protein